MEVQKLIWLPNRRRRFIEVVYTGLGGLDAFGTIVAEGCEAMRTGVEKLAIFEKRVGVPALRVI
jgi:hypothetical protein